MAFDEQLARVRPVVMKVPGVEATTESVKSEERAGASLLAGGLAYRLFFWLVAFGLVLAAAMSFWVRSQPDDAEKTAKSFGLAGVAAHSARSAIAEGSHARWYFLIVGAVLAIYFGMGAVRAMRVSAILAWRLDPVRMSKPIRSSALFNVGIVAAILSGLAAQWLRHHAPGIGVIAVGSTGAVFVGVAVVAYRALPHPADVEWRALLPGAIELGIGMALIQIVAVLYLAAKLERSPALYGNLGAATVVLLWLFMFARLLVSGMFLNATLYRRRQVGP